MRGEPAPAATLLGLAVGDALGAPYEFAAEPPEPDPAKLKMSGGGIWEPGEWSDDTAMALCLAESILATRSQERLFDEDDLARRYANWAARGPKDIGITCANALLKETPDAATARRRAYGYHQRKGHSAGNGTIMRCAPIAIAARSDEEALAAARADATLTHYELAAAWTSAALVAALRSPRRMVTAATLQGKGDERIVDALGVVVRCDEEGLRELAQAHRGTAWATLAVGLWCAVVIDDFAEGVAYAISLGGDSDTDAAVAGALLAARHGAEAIPERWLKELRERERIERIAAAIAPTPALPRPRA